jgi:hypothetical protein
LLSQNNCTPEDSVQILSRVSENLQVIHGKDSKIKTLLLQKLIGEVNISFVKDNETGYFELCFNNSHNHEYLLLMKLEGLTEWLFHSVDYPPFCTLYHEGCITKRVAVSAYST